ncbi:MAG: GTP-binding protein, partial [Nitrospirales bacterium]|nr:GTP-binding protein [Nitrospirales bacterium]
MKEPRVDTIRNVAFIGSTGAGKTSLLEALLYIDGAIPSIGSIIGGNTISDFEPEEIHRKISISNTVGHFSSKETILNIVDTPGAASFLGEAKAALRAVDGVVIVIGASSGVRSEMESFMAVLDELGLPCLLFINQLDKERTDWAATLSECQEALKRTLLPVTIPLGTERQLEGVIDVARGVSHRSTKESPKVHQRAVTPDFEAMTAEARKRLVEGAAEIDDRLLEKYLAEGDLSVEEIIDGVKLGTVANKCMPVLGGSAIQTVGAAALLEAIALYLPSPR